MTRHTTQQQCLEVLFQSWTDGGAQQYVQQSLGEWDVRQTGDGYCAIAALVHASLQPPTGQAYGNAKMSLQFQQRHHIFRQRMFEESTPRYFFRRVKQFFVTPTFDPNHGTPSPAILRALMPMGYQVIYPNQDQEWHCTCDPRCLYVLDVVLPDGGHTMTIHNGTAYTTAPFDPADTRVLNVYRLPPEKTQHLVTYRKYEEAYQEWHDNMEQNIRNQVPIPRPGHYVN